MTGSPQFSDTSSRHPLAFTEAGRRLAEVHGAAATLYGAKHGSTAREAMRATWNIVQDRLADARREMQRGGGRLVDVLGTMKR